MLGGRFKNSALPIGLDVGDYGVRLVQLGERDGCIVVAASAQQALPTDIKMSSENYQAGLAKTIGEALRSAAFSGRRVVSCMPASSMQYVNLRLPKMPSSELAAAVMWEAKDRLGHSDVSLATQYIDAGEVRQGEDVRQEVILMSAPEALVETHVGALIASGLQPVAIDAQPTALGRLYETTAAPQDDDVATVVVDTGWTSSKVLILRSNRVLFFKTIEIGEALLRRAMAEKLKVPLAEVQDLLSDAGSVTGASNARSNESMGQAVAEAVRPVLPELGREIALCLRYYGVTFRGPRPQQAALVGGGACMEWFGPSLQEHAGIAFGMPMPLAGIEFPMNQGAPWALATGLSLRDETRRIHLLDRQDEADEQEPAQEVAVAS